MDCASSVRFANALSFLTTTNQQHVLRYLALLEARNYAISPSALIPLPQPIQPQHETS